MSEKSYAGYWTGTFEGTNQGGLSVDIKEEHGVLSGLAKFSEPAVGQYEYVLSGREAEQLSLKLTPTRAQAHINRLKNNRVRGPNSVPKPF